MPRPYDVTGDWRSALGGLRGLAGGQALGRLGQAHLLRTLGHLGVGEGVLRGVEGVAGGGLLATRVRFEIP